MTVLRMTGVLAAPTGAALEDSDGQAISLDSFSLTSADAADNSSGDPPCDAGDKTRNNPEQCDGDDKGDNNGTDN